MTTSLMTQQLYLYVDFDSKFGIEISYRSKEKYLHLKGTLIVPDPEHFYEPVKDWIERMSMDKEAPIHLCFELNHFDTSATKFIFMIATMLDTYWLKGHDVKIIWTCPLDDTDMQETGEIISEHVNFPFEQVLVKP